MALEKEDIMALIAILQKGLEDNEESLAQPKRKKPRKKAVSKKTKPTRPNNFDNMSEKNMHKADSAIDKQLWGNNAPTQRSRQFKLVAVKCRTCGKTESVNPVLVESIERYKCNKCCASGA